jgi:hypothetical protein
VRVKEEFDIRFHTASLVAAGDLSTPHFRSLNNRRHGFRPSDLAVDFNVTGHLC